MRGCLCALGVFTVACGMFIVAIGSAMLGSGHPLPGVPTMVVGHVIGYLGFYALLD